MKQRTGINNSQNVSDVILNLFTSKMCKRLTDIHSPLFHSSHTVVFSL